MEARRSTLCPGELTGLRSKLAGDEPTDFNTCGYMLISFLEFTPSEPLARKIRAIWRGGPVGSLCTRALPGKEYRWLKYALMKQRIP